MPSPGCPGEVKEWSGVARQRRPGLIPMTPPEVRRLKSYRLNLEPQMLQIGQQPGELMQKVAPSSQRRPGSGTGAIDEANRALQQARVSERAEAEQVMRLR